MDVSGLDLVYALCATAGSCQDCCTVDRLYIVLGSRRRAAQKRACVTWERVSLIYSRLCVWCACDADLSGTLVSTLAPTDTDDDKYRVEQNLARIVHYFIPYILYCVWLYLCCMHYIHRLLWYTLVYSLTPLSGYESSLFDQNTRINHSFIYIVNILLVY